MKIKQGHRYKTVCGNTVEIELEVSSKDKDGNDFSYLKGRPIHVIEGHEGIKNKTHRYNKKGQWIDTQSDLGKSIHDCAEDLGLA